MSGIPFDTADLLSRVTQESLVILRGETSVSGRRDFRCVWANFAIASLLQAKREDLVGRLFLELLPDGGQLYELLVHSEATKQIVAGEADVHPIVAPVTRIAYRIIPEDGVLAVSLADRSPLREAEARERWLEQIVMSGAKLSAVAAAILRPIVTDDSEVTDIEVEYVNDMGAALLDTTPSEAVGLRVSSLAPTLTRPGFFTESVGAIWRSGVPAVFEMLDIQSVLRAESVRCHVIPLGSKVVLHVHDISAKRAAQRSLKASEHRYRSLFETANEGIALVNLRGVFLVANEFFAAMLGQKLDELVGTSLLDVLAKGERNRAQADAQAVIRGENPSQRRQVRMLRRDGSEFWALVATNVTRDPDGKIDGFLIMALDIDEQNRAAAELAFSEARYRAIVKHADVLIALTDRRGLVVFANDRLLATLGTTLDAIIGNPVNTFYVGRDQITTQAAFDSLRFGRADHANNQITLIANDGRHIPAVGSMVALRDTEGEFDGLVIVGADITRLLEQENARRNLAAALAVAEQHERERLAADLHDGPVQTLTALSLRLGGALRTARVDLGLISTSEELVQGAIRELRMLLFQMTPPNLTNDTLGACLVDRARKLLDSEVEVHVDDRSKSRLDNRVTEALFRIGQEALVNIAKHAAAKSVTVSIYETASDVVVEIVDDGVGAQPEAFVRHSVGHLGVSGMLSRAQLLGGKCEVTSSPGNGTAVFIRLPIRFPSASQ